MKLRNFVYSSLLGLPIYYILMGDFKSLGPRNFQWIPGDNTAAYIAQLFFLSDSWRFPLASNPNFGLELSTSLIYTGPPIPIVLIHKLIGLDPALQFIGVWLLGMLILQIYFGTLLGTLLGLNRLQSKVFGLLTVTPFFLYRFQFHFWLTGHFLILWALSLVVRVTKGGRVSRLELSSLLVISYLINSYLLAMVLLIVSYLILKSSDELKSRLKLLLAPLFSLAFTYFLFDFRAQKASLIESFRMNFTGEYTFYSSNLLALINPEVGYSRDCTKGHCIFGDMDPPEYILRNLSFTKLDFGGVQGNAEGYLYLGMGLIFLLLVALALELKNFSKTYFLSLWSRHKVLIIYFLFIVSYSITYKISFGNYELYFGDPKWIRWGLSMFRASGRFMWIIAYSLLIVIVLILARRLNHPAVLTSFLFLSLLLQILDMGPALKERQSALARVNIVSVPELELEERYISEWSQGKDSLLLYPAGTREGWPTMAHIAWKNDLASGSFSTSRLNYAELVRVDNRLKDIVCRGDIPSTWLVAIVNSSISEFSECENFSKLRVQKGDKFYLIASGLKMR